MIPPHLSHASDLRAEAESTRLLAAKLKRMRRHAQAHRAAMEAALMERVADGVVALGMPKSARMDGCVNPDWLDAQGNERMRETQARRGGAV